MPKPGDVLTVDFLGAAGLKRRPAVVVSSDAYNAERPDIILGVLTTNVSAATTRRSSQNGDAAILAKVAIEGNCLVDT